jgi:ribose-phosphate pyrophosphokinase
MIDSSDHSLLFWPQFENTAHQLAANYGIDACPILQRSFPDGESYIRLDSSSITKNVWIFGSLFPPNDRIIELSLISDTLRKQGAHDIHLVSPYLPYMRQDIAFNKGEAISAYSMGRLISHYVDSIVTVDPHLHRIIDLKLIFQCKTAVLHSHKLLAGWIRNNCTNPVIIGPDSESQQWVGKLAADLNVPYVVFSKRREGDTDVKIMPQGLESIRSGQPIIVDDIISTGTTMATAGRLIMEKTGNRPMALAVHGIFADKAYQQLTEAGFRNIVTTDSIQHKTNAIDLYPILKAYMHDQLSPLS